MSEGGSPEPRRRLVRARRLWTAVATLLSTMIVARADAAELRIFSPVVEQGEVNFENNSAVTFDKAGSKNGQQTHFAEIEYGVTDFWRLELEGKWDTGADGLRFRTADIASIFALLRQDEHALDGALFIEYDHAVDGRSPETATVGGLFRKDFGRSGTTANLFFDNELGRNASSGIRLRYSGISTWRVDALLAPGLEAFGEPGKVGHFSDVQDHRLGPAIAGAADIEGIGSLSYSIGYVFGLSPGAPSGTVVWRLEFGVRF